MVSRLFWVLDSGVLACDPPLVLFLVLLGRIRGGVFLFRFFILRTLPLPSRPGWLG